MLLKRSADSDEPRTWGTPGGKVELGEDIEEAAKRESMEEIGALPYGERELISSIENDDGLVFHTFKQPIMREFKPKLNGEHTGYLWASLDDLPNKVHPGVFRVIDAMNKPKQAQDAEHWITTETGSHLLIDGEEGAGYEIKGGAGGKLNGTKVNPQSMSEARLNEKTSSFSNPEFKPHEEKKESTKTSIPQGHHRLKSPQKIEKETEKAYAIANPNHPSNDPIVKAGGRLDYQEMSYSQREAYKNRETLQWIPKSHAYAENGEVVSMSPWLAQKNGHQTTEGLEEKQKAFSEGSKRYQDLIAQAKAAGVPGIREKMKTSTIKEKMRAHGLAVDSDDVEDQSLDFMYAMDQKIQPIDFDSDMILPISDFSA